MVGVKIMKLGAVLILTTQLVACDKTANKEEVQPEQHTTQNVKSSEIKTVKTSVDWTPVFASWQQGCTDGPIFTTLRDGLYDYPATAPDPDLPQPGKIVLPEQYKKVVSPEIIVKRASGSTDFSIKVNEGTYYGMKLSKIGVYAGHGNGINGRYIEVEPTDAELRQFFKNVEFEMDYENGDEYMDFKAIIDVDDDKVTIACDASM